MTRGGFTRLVRTALALAAIGLTACDDSQVWHTPDPSLARMQEQPRIDPFDREMRAPPPFSIARGTHDDHPAPAITRALVERGRAHYETICATCHGVGGDGVSVVASKMVTRPPPSLLDPRIRALSDAQLSEVIARGYGLMPPFENDLPEGDRYATIAYVRALQIARGVDVSILPPPIASALAKEAP